MTDLGSSKTFGCTWGIYSGNGYAPWNRTDYDALKSSFNMTRKERSSTGYWKTTDYIWGIITNQLGDMLRESGTANITFMMDINMGLKYKVMTTSEGNLIGDATLSWSGMWGTLQLAHEEGKVS